MRPVEGLRSSDFAAATIRSPTREVDELLEQIGENGAITLVGMASAAKDGIVQVRMSEVHTINGSPVGPPPR